MPKACAIKFGLSSGVSQADILALLSREKIEAIQTASGLCVKASVSETKAALKAHAADVTIADLSEEELTLPDVAAFI